AEIETAYHTLAPLLGAGAAGVLLLSLIASGLSSSTVGTMAGQMIMQGFVGFRIPLWVRRLVTMAPAFRRGRGRSRCDQGAGPEPGGAQRRPAGADDFAHPLHGARRRHGRFRQQPSNSDPGCRRGRRGAVAQYFPDRAGPRFASVWRRFLRGGAVGTAAIE